MCKTVNETIKHIFTACAKLAGSGYLKSHNSVAAVIHMRVCQKYSIETPAQDWLHIPETITENNEAKMLCSWDFEIRTDRVIKARRPDIVILDKKS